MRFSYWMMLIAVVVGVGWLQVSQRNALFLKGYAVGERLQRVHVQETDLSWLHAKVVGLTSPTRLAEVAQHRQLNFVAWSRLAPLPPLMSARPSPLLHTRGTPQDGEVPANP